MECKRKHWLHLAMEQLIVSFVGTTEHQQKKFCWLLNETHLFMIDEYMTSKTCSKCFGLVKLTRRIAWCQYCHIMWDRDTNAANNMIKLVICEMTNIPRPVLMQRPPSNELTNRTRPAPRAPRVRTRLLSYVDLEIVPLGNNFLDDEDHYQNVDEPMDEEYLEDDFQLDPMAQNELDNIFNQEDFQYDNDISSVLYESESDESRAVENYHHVDDFDHGENLPGNEIIRDEGRHVDDFDHG